MGKDYNTTRKADPYIVGKILEFLAPKPERIYLDIGCGTGNYLHALAQSGFHFHGLDPSIQMLEQAKKSNPTAVFFEGVAERLPFAHQCYDGAIGILTIHHWQDKLKGLIEVNRILKPTAKLVLFTFTPQQMMGYWLHHYFPKMIHKCTLIAPPLDEMESALRESGFSSTKAVKYFVRDDLQDHFLYSYKFQPEKYLLEEVRNGTSGFRVFCDADELTTGLNQLQNDIESGAIKNIIKQYENDLGDYLFIIAEK